MRIEGGCHCGRISYAADVDPAAVTICHCTDCQTLSGTAFRTVVPAAKESFRLSGQPKIYVKTGDSGARRVQAFCPDCGSPIYSSAVEDPQVYNIRVGTCRQRAELKPQKQIWCRSSLDWLAQIGAVARHQEQSSA
jgi:hypothetical protein